MSYNSSLGTVQWKDGAQLDAFGRHRSSVPFTIFDSQFEYDLKTRHWETAVTGSPAGSVSHLPNESAAQLSTGTTNASSAVLQTRDYFRYHPGRSQQMLIAVVMGAAATGTTKRAGYFDASNGYFLEQTPTVVNLVRRSYASGAMVPEEVPQASWNLDTLDGNGPSGKTLDLSKIQILAIDAQGCGRIRMGFDIGGETIYAHQFTHANIITTPGHQTLNLPIRYEISNDGTGAAVTMKAVCQSVLTEGGAHEEIGVNLAYGATATALAASGTLTPILALRLKPTFGTKVNRGQIVPLGVHIIAGANPVLVQLFIGGSLSVTGGWTSIGTTSIAERHETISSYTPGENIMCFHVGASGGGSKTAEKGEVELHFPAANDIAGTSPTPLVLAVTGLGGTSACYYAIEWRENKG